MMAIFFMTYASVFVAEIVGDKLLYTTGVLATRYRARPIVFGMTVAFMIKMALAVAVGQAIASLPPLLVAAISALSFSGVAYTLWRKDERRTPSDLVDDQPSKAAAVSFVTVLLSEVGDVGQITTATLAAQFASPVTVWAGAVAAMVTKGVLAASIGSRVRVWLQDRIAPRTFRYGGVIALAVLGALSIAEVLSRRH